MKNVTRLASCPAIFAAVAILIGWFLVLPTRAEAQTVGNNAVYYYTTSNPGVCCKGSGAFIDASMLLHSGSDICDTIYGLFTGRTGFPPYPSAGAVIDARGISGSALTCTKGSPWTESGSSATLPSTILLPATTPSAPIVIPTPWILPNNTRLIGEGDNDPTSATPLTTIQASSSFSGNMIQFGGAGPRFP